MAEPTFDPYALAPESIQEPPQSLGLALRKIGPGLILAGSIVGTGELIATTNLGAQVGFSLLWLVVLSCFIKVFVQIELGRYAVSSGETTLTSLRRLPGAGVLLVWWWLIMMLGTQTQLGAMVGGVGQAFHLAMPDVSPWLAEAVSRGSPWLGDYIRSKPIMPWAFLTAASAAVLLVSGSYAVVENGTTALVVIFTIMTVVCVGILPWTPYAIDWQSVVDGFRFQVPESSGAIFAALAMFGITGVGASELFSYPYWCIEKGYARFAGPRGADADWERRAKGWLRVMRLDAWASMLVYTLATLAFYFLGGAVLFGEFGGKGIPQGDEMVPTLARMYAPVMGASAATWFFVVGGFAVLYSTLFVASASHSRLLTDFLRVNEFIVIRDHAQRLRWIRCFCVCYPTLALILYATIGEPRVMVTIGGFVQAITLPMICTVAVFLRYRRTDPRLRPGVLWDLFLWLSVVGMTIVAARPFVTLWQDFAAKK